MTHSVFSIVAPVERANVEPLQKYLDPFDRADKPIPGLSFDDLSLPRSRSGMLSTDSMALITGWRWGRGATGGITPTRSIAVGVDLTEHAKAVRQLAQ